MFKESPNFTEIEFMLTPDLREFISGADDIPIDIRDTVSYF